ncbi:MAG: hypothetical protein KKC05_03085 [Nanoarchaeota archaeon]|nr:hypothetical protein [Nanoarchaeota archaeon]
MGLFRILFGWNWKIRRLRKKWDRIREKSLKEEGPFKIQLLEKLDLTENNLRTLEERPLVRHEKARLCKEVELDLVEIDALRKEGKKAKKD